LEQTLSRSKAQPLLILSDEGAIKQFSSGFSQIFFPVQEGDPLAQYIHPEDRTEFKNWFKSLDHNNLQTGPVKNLRMIDHKGMIVSAMVRPELADQGYVFWFWEDRRTAETEDYWRTALTPALEAVLTGILDGVFLVDTEGKLVEVNPALCQMLGYHKFELIGLPVGTLFSSDEKERKEATSRFARILKGSRVKEISLVLADKSGHNFEVSFNGAIIRGEGNELVGIMGIVRDNRESKVLKDLSHKTKELEKAFAELGKRDKIKDDFLSLVGHELRTPLANILGYAEFLHEGELKEKEREEFIGVIYQEARRLARLVNEILDLSRLEAGRLIYHHVLQPLTPVLDEAADAVAAEASQKNIRITRKFEAETEIWIDRDRIKQVTINLLNNAIKYSDQDTEIKFSSQEMDQGALVMVEDQGYGIAREHHEKVFEKFSRVDALEHHTQGAGLGLPIAKKIVEEGHSGRMWLLSEGLGKGSTFSFWLPRSAKNAG
jgi:PAS domain S-box-containing protein